MPGHALRGALLSSCVALLGFTTGCHQAVPPESPLKIVGVSQIDRGGAQVQNASQVPPADPAGDGRAMCPPVSIGLATALTGPDTSLGLNVEHGLQLAVDRHNAANPQCQVAIRTFDTENDAQKASEVAPQVVDDSSIIGLVGPTFSGETQATGGVFSAAGLVAATPGATNVTLSQNGWKTFFRGLANDGVQGPSVANYLKNAVGSKKSCVIDDSTSFGLGIADAVRATLGPIATPDCNIEVKRGDKDFSAAVTQVRSAASDSIFYGGYYAEAALLVQQLRDARVSATFVAGDGSKDPEFVKQAGMASENALLSCPCAPATGLFADTYTKRWGHEPGTYSTEAYDLGTIMLKGIDSGRTTRPALLEFFRNYQGQGVARRYAWHSDGELTTELIWMYKVQ
jgi:branched-chain amino acid transport system substrate-binding protein